MRIKLLAASLLALAAPAMAEDWRDDYQVVKFGILSGENEADRIQRNEPLRAYLEAELGIEVEIFTAGAYDGVIQALGADQIEIARFGSSSYAAAYTATNGGVVPTLTTLRADGNSGYRSIVVSRCDSGITSLEDARGMVHAFADPDSTSGYAVPLFNMVTVEGIEPEEYFSAVPFSGSHEAGVQGVVNGTFDTAATWQNNESDGVFQRMVNKGLIEAGIVCAIWESPEITSGPWTFRANLPADMIEDITVALEEFAAKDPEGFDMREGNAGNDNPAVGYMRVSHDRYQWIIDMRQWIRDRRRETG